MLHFNISTIRTSFLICESSDIVLSTSVSGLRRAAGFQYAWILTMPGLWLEKFLQGFLAFFPNTLYV